MSAAPTISAAPTQYTPNMTGIPETMLWTLHNRAMEARRPDGVLSDPVCINIYDSLDYDFERNFGKAEPSHGVRARVFDVALREFLFENPNAVVVNLGEGLETQRFRVETGPEVMWLSVDLPEAIEIRERFIKPDESHIHIAKSALDTSWFDSVPEGRPVFVTAQGLFMYFQEEEVGALIAAMSQRWPESVLMFDHVPRWLSRKSMSAEGWKKTGAYQVPPLPWGVNRSEVGPLLRRWTGDAADTSERPFWFPRGIRRAMFQVVMSIPWMSERTPGITMVRLGARTTKPA